MKGKFCMSEPHKEWLESAESDLQFATVGFQDEFYSHVCFLSQQAIEKILKGILVSQGKFYPKTHNLRELIKLVSGIDLKRYYTQVSIIDGYYVPMRYPDAAPGSRADRSPNREEAWEALEIGRGILKEAKAFLN